MNESQLIAFLKWVSENLPVSTAQINKAYDIPPGLLDQLVGAKILLRGYHEYCLGLNGLDVLLHDKRSIGADYNSQLSNLISFFALIVAIIALLK